MVPPKPTASKKLQSAAQHVGEKAVVVKTLQCFADPTRVYEMDSISVSAEGSAVEEGMELSDIGSAVEDIYDPLEGEDDDKSFASEGADSRVDAFRAELYGAELRYS